ncbi:MAG: ribosome assembly cofactor RimP [Bacteroidales bacterium]|jgi:ribosome maturation factor RimP|nr:ribosome assembly cofactor RimP [Bacteroidales bacterium]
MISAQQVQELFEQAPELSQYFIVDIKVTKDNVISIKADTDAGITIDQCGEISRVLEGLMDREKEDYELEVSSPGLTEPLRITRQYLKNIGKEVDILMNDGEKLKGKIVTADDNGVTIEQSHNEKQNGKKVKVTTQQTLNFIDIKSVKLKITFK